MEKKSVLFIGGNFSPEPTGIGKYSGEMIEWLSEKGVSCTVITTFPYYPFWKVQVPYKKRSFWFKTEIKQTSKSAAPIRIIRAPHYIPSKPTATRRMISDFSFFFSAYLVILVLLFYKKRDYVIAVAPPFQLGLLAKLYKKVKGAKFVYHIQDLQIDAARDLHMIKSPAILKFLFAIEKFILKSTDHISTISPGMVRKVQAKCKKDILLFPNWVDTRQFFPVADKEQLKRKFGFKNEDKIILYSGAIGEKQGLETILYCAEHLQKDKKLKFVICGSGPYKEKLKILKDRLGLQNVIFYPLQPMEKFNEFLNMADIHLLLQKINASDLVMPSKLAAILSIGGLAIVTATKDTSLYDIVSSSNVGVLVAPENQSALITAIEASLRNENTVININARLYAELHLSHDKVLNRFSSSLFKIKTSYNKEDVTVLSFE